MIKYKKGSLFDAPPGVILVHACNAQGVWGSGIALQFKERFPYSFKNYNMNCTAGLSPVGSGYVIDEKVGCLITSENYGSEVDSPEEILLNTAIALTQLCDTRQNTDFHSNKFNSGLFDVPWEMTEYILNKVLRLYPHVSWTVWSQE